MDPMAELAARPTLEQTLDRYEQMQQRIFDTLSAELGPYDWRTFSEGSGAGCGEDFPSDSPGETRSLPSWGFEEAISDTDWPRAEQIVTDITAEYGFTPPRTLADRTGQHDIAGVDTYGGNYQFGTQINTVWRVATGCHLPEGAALGR